MSACDCTHEHGDHIYTGGCKVVTEGVKCKCTGFSHQSKATVAIEPQEPWWRTQFNTDNKPKPQRTKRRATTTAQTKYKVNFSADFIVKQDAKFADWYVEPKPYEPTGIDNAVAKYDHRGILLPIGIANRPAHVQQAGVCTVCGCNGSGACARIVENDGSIRPARDTGFRMKVVTAHYAYAASA